MDVRPTTRLGCSDGPSPLDFDFTMAFQPIVDVATGAVFAHEALARGLSGEGAASVLARLTPDNRSAFDQLCRIKAVELAARLRLPGRVSINFLPNAVFDPVNCLRTTLEATRSNGFPLERIMLEVTEGEKVSDARHLHRIFDAYKRSGLTTAIDDFGSGWSGLNLLAEYQPDVIKLDMELTRRIDASPARRAIVRGIVSVCRDLGITVIAEGVETDGERRMLSELGITLMQGFLFARPAFEALPEIAWPVAA